MSEAHRRGECLPGCIYHGKAPGLAISGKIHKDYSYGYYHAPTHLPMQAADAEERGDLKRNPELASYLEMRINNLKDQEEIMKPRDFAKTGGPLDD